MAIVVTPDHDGTQDTGGSEGGVYSDSRSFLVTGLRAAHPDTGKRRLSALFHPSIPRDGSAHPLGLGLTVLRRTVQMLAEDPQDKAVVKVQYGQPDVAQFDPQQNGTDVRIGTTSGSVESNIDGAGNDIETEHTAGSKVLQTISTMESMSTLEFRRLQQSSPGLTSQQYVRHVNSVETATGNADVGCWYCQSISGEYVAEVNQWLASFVFIYRAPYTAPAYDSSGSFSEASPFKGWEIRVIEHDPSTGNPYLKDAWTSKTVLKVMPYPTVSFVGLDLTW